MIWLASALCLALQTEPPELNQIDPILVDSLRREAPYLDVAKAELQLRAATSAACAIGVEPELVLAIAYVESRYRPEVVSRAHGSRFCGVMQARATTEEACIEMQNPAVGYREGAAVLARWIVFAKGDVRAALGGYGCGVAGVKHGCRRFAERVLAVKRRLVVRSGS